MICRYSEKCPYFNDKALDIKVQDSYKEKYCQTQFKYCARYLIKETLGEDQVLNWLNPSAIDTAISVIKKNIK